VVALRWHVPPGFPFAFGRDAAVGRPPLEGRHGLGGAKSRFGEAAEGIEGQLGSSAEGVASYVAGKLGLRFWLDFERALLLGDVLDALGVGASGDLGLFAHPTLSHHRS
jgi:hypothetical protein